MRMTRMCSATRRTEIGRIATLRSYAVLDTPAEPVFDRITALARLTVGTSMATISLIDDNRQWFKSRQGVESCETGRNIAFCDHALPLARGEVMVVPDASVDPRFFDNPLVTGAPHIRFYAGAVLTSPEGDALGTLCVFDPQPRQGLTPLQHDTLVALAELVMSELEVRRITRRSAAKRELLEMAEAMSGVGHWRLDVATDHVDWSDEVYRIHGVERASYDPSLQGGLSFYPPADQEAVAAHIARAVAEKSGFTFQLHIDRTDGERRTVSCRAACELDPAGAVIALLGVFQDVTEQERLLEAVKAERERYRLLADKARDIITSYSPDGVITYVSPSIGRLKGLTPDAVVGRKIYELIHPEDRDGVAEALRGLAKTRDASRRIEYRALRPDGSSVWVEAHPSPMRDAAGRLTGFQDVVRDTTIQREALARAQESEARYRLLAENATDVIATYGPDGRITFLSPSIEELLGRAPESLAGRTTYDIIHPDDRAAVTEAFRGLVASGEASGRIEYRAMKADGTFIWVEAHPSPVRDPAGRLTGFQDTVRDISARKAALAQAQHSEARYRLLAENASDMISVTSLDSTVRFVTPAVTRILGFAPEELVGRQTLELTHPDDRAEVVALFSGLVTGGPGMASSSYQFRGRHKDGRWIWLEGQPRVQWSADGRPLAFQDVVRDITARKLLEAELDAARRAAEAAAQAKADFLANMSHELRTPLTSIIGFTELAADQPELADATRDYVRRVRNASQALLSTVNDILDFSKLEAGQVTLHPAPTDVAALVRDAVELFLPQAAAKHLAIRSEPAEGVPASVLIDGERLRQLVLNLVGNAVKFTEAGEVAVSLSHVDGRLRVAVRDTGRGISHEDQARLFRRFSQVDGSSTRQHGGTGLGLAICRGLAEQMGGTVSVRSAPGRGSVFSLDLPAPRAAQAAAARETFYGPAAVRLDGVRVLVVDDNPANRELARVILAGAGAEPTQAQDGRRALELCAAEPFDAVLLDMRMPDMDGAAVLSRLRAEGGPNDAVPVLAYTANMREADEAALAAAGYDGFVAKPVDPPALLEAVRRATAFEQTPRRRIAHVG